MWKQMQRNTAALMIFCLFVFGAIGLVQSPEKLSVSALAYQSRGELLIIDAGHGGEDGGAVSLSGALESQINLSIAQKLDELMTLCGVKTLMLRQEDVSLHDEGANTLREKKVSDLHNRVETINENSNATVISLHQNTYPGASSRGAQVFYTGTGAGMEFAVHTQAMLVKYLDPFNHREAAKIPNTVYLMNHIECPAILVECGFLSNPEESKKLESEEYQKKLAIVLGAACLIRD